MSVNAAVTGAGEPPWLGILGSFLGIPLGWLLAIGLLVAGGASAYRYLRRRRKEEDLERLIARDPRLKRTVIPCGLRPDQISWWCRGLPDGDRNHGLEYGVEGPQVIDLGAGMPRETTVAAFRWWYEVEQRSNRNRRRGLGGMGMGGMGMGNRRGHTTYSKRYLPAALVQLPVHVDHRILISPESVLGRVGLTRGGQQLESSEFNRRFRVEAREEQLSLNLLDAGFQQLLVEEFQGRTIEIFGELLLVGGQPSHRDESLSGVIGELPAMRQDAHRILHAVPPAFWRRIPGGHS